MNILKSILISMTAGTILATITLVIDHIIVSRSIDKIYGFIARLIILGGFLIPLLLWASRESPRLAIIQKDMSVSYHKKAGLKVEGIFSGGENKHIYLLVRPISNTEKEVWTVAKEVVSIDFDRLTWYTRIYLPEQKDEKDKDGMKPGEMKGSIKPGDIYSLIGIITEETLKDNEQKETPQLRKIKGAFTEEIEIKIKEVSDD